ADHAAPRVVADRRDERDPQADAVRSRRGVERRAGAPTEAVGLDVVTELRPLSQSREHHVDGWPARDHQVVRRVHAAPHAARSTTTWTSPAACCTNEAGTSGPTAPSRARCTIVPLL